ICQCYPRLSGATAFSIAVRTPTTVSFAIIHSLRSTVGGWVCQSRVVGTPRLLCRKPRFLRSKTSSSRRWACAFWSAIYKIVTGRESAAPPEAFRDKIVLIGATAVGLADQRVTPFDLAFPGVETHATVMDNVLRQRFLVAPWWGSWYTTANIVLVGLGLILLLPHLGALGGYIVTTLGMLGNVGLNYAFFSTQGWVLSIMYPLLATFVVWLGMTLYHFLFE